MKSPFGPSGPGGPRGPTGSCSKNKTIKNFYKVKVSKRDR